MTINYREDAEYLIENASNLQKQLLINAEYLIEHASSVLEKVHAQLKAKDEEIRILKEAGSRLLRSFEELGKNKDPLEFYNLRNRCEVDIVALNDIINTPG